MFCKTTAFLFLASKIKYSQAQASACTDSETASFSHDDISGILKFLQSKDCNLSIEAQNNEFLNEISDHGCWCGALSGLGGQGSPIDEVDSSCRAWSTCSSCVSLESCNIDGNGNEDTTFHIEYDATTKSFHCLSPTGCGFNKCLCNLELAESVFNSVKNGQTAITAGCAGAAPANVPKTPSDPEENESEANADDSVAEAIPKMPKDKCCQDANFGSIWERYSSATHYCDASSGVLAISQDQPDTESNHEPQEIPQMGTKIPLLEEPDQAWLSVVADNCVACTGSCAFEHSSSNNKYALCEQGAPIVLQCPENMLWDQDLLTCEFPPELTPVVTDPEDQIPEDFETPIIPVAEISPCENCTNADRWNQDPNNVCFLVHEEPQKFYKCDHGEAVIHECTAGLVWDHNILTCNWPNNGNGEPIMEVDNDVATAADPADASADDQTINICEGCTLADRHNMNPDNVCFLRHENVDMFYKCDHGEAVPYDCAAGLIWDHSILTCNWPDLVPVIDEPEPEPQPEPQPDSENPINDVNDASADQNICDGCTLDDRWNRDPNNVCFLVHEDVHKFYKCDHGEPVPYDCAGGLVWDHSILTCDWPTNF